MRKMPYMMALLTMSLSAFADTVELKDGRKLNGKVLLFDGQELRLADGTKYAAPDVAAIRFDTAADVASPITQVPAGTVVAVRTIDPIDSQNAQPGQTFRANLDEDLLINGAVAAPKGADAVLRLVEAKGAGRMKGAAQLTISLASVKLGDRVVEVNSEALTSTGAGKGKGTAARVSVGAGVGLALGSILGGRKGAALGTAAGAGAGTVVALATKGPRVSIPSETRLSFTVQ